MVLKKVTSKSPRASPHDNGRINVGHPQFPLLHFADLAPVLEAALESHFEGTKSEGKATAILVIHDGEPYSKDMVKQTLAIAANRIDTGTFLCSLLIRMGAHFCGGRRIFVRGVGGAS